MKIVLATGPRAKGEIEMAGLPFLGIGYIASYLEKEGGHDVVIVDAHSENLTREQAAEKILSFSPEVVGLTATTHNRLQVISVIKELKKRKPDLMIMVGGPHFSLSDRNALEVVPEIDVVVKREGEITSKELLDVWPDREKLKDVLGITYREESGEIISNQDRPFLRDLSQLPFPAWHLYDLDKYQKKIYGTNFRTIGVISARGCPNQCVFCDNAAFSKSMLRLRTSQNFVDELEFLKKEYGFEGFNFWDDTLTVSKSHVLGICQEILNRGLDIKWYARARVNTVDEETIGMMKKAGCQRISFGIESGSPRILKEIKKNITLEQARYAVKLSSEAGMIVSLNFIVNLPTETIEDLKMSADLIKELRNYRNVEASYGFALIYPGTEMEWFAKKKGILDNNFSWNSPYQGKKSRITGEDPSVPYMEWPGMELERVKAFMVKNLSKGDILKKSWRKLKKVESWSDLKSLLKAGFNFIKVEPSRGLSSTLIYIANARMPTEKAHGIQIVKMCEAFALAGLDVELILPWRFNKIKEDIFQYYGIKRNFKVKKIPSLDLISLGIPRIGFWIQSMIFNKFVFLYLLFKKADIFYSRDSYSLYLPSFFKKNLVCELHTVPKSFFLHKRVFRKAKAIIVITRKIKEELIKKGVPEKKVLVAPDGVDLEEFENAIAKPKPQGKKIVLYSGHLYPWKGAQILAQVAKFLGKDILVIFIGGTESDIKKFKNKYGEIENIEVKGHLSYREIPVWLKAADVLVLPNSGKEEISKHWTSPMKMFEYMASGRPIIASDLPSLREILNKNNAFLVKPDNPKALAKGIKIVLKDENLSERISEQALEDVQKYSWQKRVENIIIGLRNR